MPTVTTTYTMATAPGALPVLGHALAFARRPLDFVKQLPAHGDLVRIKLGPQTMHMVCHPDLLHQVLAEDRVYDKGGPIFDKFRELAGNGLLGCPANAHRRQRRLVQPAFQRGRLPGYAAMTSQEITALTGAWHDGQVLDVTKAMYRLTTAVTARCMFAADMDTHDSAALYDSVEAITRGIARRAMMPVPMADRLPTRGNRRFDRARDHVRRLTDTLIANHRAGVDRGDLLSTLLAPQEERGPGLSDDEIHEQVLTFLLAGIDTTAILLSWAWHLIGTHPDIQDRLQAEVDTVLDGRPAQHADLPALEVTDRIVTETLRLYPSAWLFTRNTTSDSVLGGHRLPAGTTMMFSAYQVHRRADLYPGPDTFDPDRWQGAGKAPPGTLLPFGSGPRKCIGEVFARNEATLALASIAARWQLDPVPGRPVHPARRITLTPNALSMRLRERRLAYPRNTPEASS
ncbi:cytochrome P450 [Streptomyces sp. NPDC088135]|uniref:cytochrome P450 n=1 Tax=unclassified Streptomyces TaxID=2593676 RepID=UPI0034353721